MASPKSPTLVVGMFNDCITRRDIAGLGDLMTEDHTFIDSASAKWHGKTECLKVWAAFFAGFPDYRNDFVEIIENGGTVAVSGRSVCSDPRLQGPAIWVAKVRAEKIAKWTVLDDTPAARARLGLRGR